MTIRPENSVSDLVPRYKSFRALSLGESFVEKSFATDYRQDVARSSITADLDPRAFGRNFSRLFTDLERREETTARAFAQDLNVGEERVSKWRRGSVGVPNTKTLVKIAIRFGVSVDVLLENVCSQYESLRIVQKSTASAKENMRQSALPAKGGTHATTSTADLLQQIEAHERVLELTRRGIHDLTRRLYETDADVPRTVAAKSRTRRVRR